VLAVLGGGCVNTGTIPSKTIREAINYLTGLNQPPMYGQGYRLRDEISMQDIRTQTAQVVEREQSVVRDQLLSNHVSWRARRAFWLPIRPPSPTGAAVSGASPRRRSSSRSARRGRTFRKSSSTARLTGRHGLQLPDAR
jgi:hypothetical protein